MPGLKYSGFVFFAPDPEAEEAIQQGGQLYERLNSLVTESGKTGEERNRLILSILQELETYQRPHDGSLICIICSTAVSAFAEANLALYKQYILAERKLMPTLITAECAILNPVLSELGLIQTPELTATAHP
ncbi:MAG: hypothetical protein AABY34_03455 [Pseudomonadota bacterium]